MVMDVCQDYILVTYHPFDVHIFHIKLFGDLSPTSTPVLQVFEHFSAALVLLFNDSSTLNCHEDIRIYIWVTLRKEH